MNEFIRWFKDVGLGDVALVGGKNAALGEMVQALAPLGVTVPNGFAVTASAYRDVLERAGAWKALREVLADLKPDDVADLSARAARAREIIYAAPLPAALVEGILAGYRALREEYGADVTLAVRSSATAEDLPTASFAGQHESFLNVHGEAMLLDAVRRCFASVFNDRAVRYRIDQGFDHLKVLLSVGIMKMVRSDLAASGVSFSLDTESGFRDVVFITGAWGLGENVVQGAVDPDEFFVFKPTLAQGKRVVLRRSLGGKKVKMVYGEGGLRRATVNMPTSPEERGRFCLADEDVLALADYTVRIEEHMTRRAGHPVPVDVEWARDGVDGRIYIVQARPETVASRRSADVLTEYAIEGKPAVRVTGRAVGEKIAAGVVRIVRNETDMEAFQPGDVLVAETTSPDWGAVMKRASAIVTNRGGRTCHAAIVARELGIPAVVGAGNATTVLRDGEIVTVSCAEGMQGRVYEGRVPYTTRETDTRGLARPRTKILVNVGDPDLAFHLSFLPTGGVGLARMEFIIASHIKAHPMALLHPERIDDAAVRTEIARLARNHANGADFFVERLAEGVATIAAAFYPRPVIVRMSDFKTNEYASLLGGKWFEPAEDNPMIGFRGASRYAHPAYAEGFALECAAMKRVREAMGLDQRETHDPVLPARGRGRAGRHAHGRAGPRARRERARDLRDVRDSQQRDPRRRLLALVRRLLDRLQRPDAARARGRPRFRAGGVRLRRARPRRDGDDPDGDRGRAPQRPAYRHLRAGAVGLSRVRRVPGARGDRLHQPQSRLRAGNDGTHPRARSRSLASRSRGPGFRPGPLRHRAGG